MCNKNIILRYSTYNSLYYKLRKNNIRINKICFNKQLQNNEIK